MNEPRLTDETKEDLAELWATIAEARDGRAADRMHRKLLDACRVKARFPETGRSREEIGPGVPSFPVSPYVVFFRPDEDSILALRILHGRRDVVAVMGEAGE